MARRATKDTYGIETLSNAGEDIEIRRKVVAGQIVPDSLEVPKDALEDADDKPAVGYQAHQILGTKESDEMLKSGAYGTAEEVLPGDHPSEKGSDPEDGDHSRTVGEMDEGGLLQPKRTGSRVGKNRPAKTGATEAADEANKGHNQVDGTTGNKKADKKG